jgi:hypothetical protein
MNGIVELEVIEWYPMYDVMCTGDYLNVTVEMNGKVLKEYGDEYHDKGRHKALAFAEGYKYYSETNDLTGVRITHLDNNSTDISL